MKRQILSMILIIVLALSLCACGNKEKETTTTVIPSTEEISTEELSTNNPTNASSETPSTDVADESTTVPHKHEYSSVITKEATCVDKGLRTYTCDCGDTYTEDIKAVGHSFSKYEYNNDATVDKDGTKTAKCAICGTKDTKVAEGSKIAFTYKDINAIMYTSSSVNVRKYPTSDSEKVGSLGKAVEVKVTGQCKENNWYRIEYDGNEAYVSNKYLSKDKPYIAEPLPERYKGMEQYGTYKVVNGIAYWPKTEEDTSKYEKYNNLYEAMCKAGYNNPFYHEGFDKWYILYQSTPGFEQKWEDEEAARITLEKHLNSLGITEEEKDFIHNIGRLNLYGDYYYSIELGSY